MKRTIFVLFLTLITFSCKKDISELQKTGEIKISSETLGTTYYYSYGYSFQLEKFIPTIGSSEIIDIYLVETNTIYGTLTGVQFATKDIPESTYGFYLNGTFQSLQEAENYYSNYTTAVAPNYAVLTDTVRNYQVWTFRTWKKNYVKFLVKDVRTIFTGQTADFIEVDIKYFIQRDGTDNLTE